MPESFRTLQQFLDERTVEGVLFTRLPDGNLQCTACAHRCVLRDGKRGICQMRFNHGGRLRVPGGYTAGVAADPIEKKPFFHVLPGSKALSFGMLGCNYSCDFCQNWITSQALRDPASENSRASVQDLEAGGLVRLALDHACPVVTSTYNEPLITSEWAVEVFRLAKAQGLLTSFVSNGNATAEALEYLKPHLDLCKVDLKGFRDNAYRKTCGGPLKPVLETIERLKALGIWVEVVTLLIPGFNDTDAEIRDMAAFIASVSPDIPWHVTAFHPDYKMENRPATGADQLRRAWTLGHEAGLRFVYSGNRPGEAENTENTYCPSCRFLLVERFGFQVARNVIGANGLCPSCGQAIAGVWKHPSEE